jgi:hypothetical protein
MSNHFSMGAINKTTNNYEMLQKDIRRFARENRQVKSQNSVIIL